MAQDAFTPATYSDTLPSTSVGYAPSNIATDPQSYLPRGLPSERFRQLVQHADDLHKIIPEFSLRQEANLARAECERRITKLLDHPARGGFNLPEDDPRVVAERKTFDRLVAEAKRLDDLNTQRSAAWQAAGSVLRNVQSWLVGGKPSGTVLESFEGPQPVLQKGEGILDGIERLRRRVRELKADVRRIQSAPFPSAHARAKMRQQVESLAAKGVPDVSRMVEHDLDVEWPTVRHSEPLVGGVTTKGAVVTGITSWHQIDTAALFCWLHRDALVARLDAEIASEADDRSALSHEKRGEAEAEALVEILATERDECALVWRAQSEGISIEHRADVSVAALLSLRLVTVSKAEPSPSSPWHAVTLGGWR